MHLKVALSLSLIVVMELFFNPDFTFNPDFEFKMSKNLIRSKHQSRSLEGPIKSAFHKGCEIDVLNGKRFLPIISAKS